jgi:hypothetical protein
VMVLRAGNKVSVVEITSPVAAGDEIPATAMREVMLSEDSGVPFVRWDQRETVMNNWRAATNLVANSVLSTSMIAPKDQVLTPGKSVVGLSLKEGQFPNGLKAGDTVAAYDVSTRSAGVSGSAADSTGAGTGTDSTLISGNLIVRKVLSSSGDFSSGQTSVTVLVDSADAGPLTVAASSDTVALVLVASKN